MQSYKKYFTKLGQTVDLVCNLFSNSTNSSKKSVRLVFISQFLKKKILIIDNKYILNIPKKNSIPDPVLY